MGSRGNIAIDSLEDDRVYFHTHWGGDNIVSILKQIIKDAKKMVKNIDHQHFQWDDPIYLGHILYSRLAGQFESYSFPFDNEYPVPVVDLKKKRIHFEECLYEEREYTFEEFLSTSPETFQKTHGSYAVRR